MLLSGYSINILTMFGMVLAIGIIVDDAIVVVENVERLMEEKAFPARRYPAGHAGNHPGDYRDHAGAYRRLYPHGFC
jgi:preprotein translocase subunit SecD